MNRSEMRRLAAVGEYHGNDLRSYTDQVKRALGLLLERAEALEDLLREVQEDVCSLNCPSTWTTATGRPPHSDPCRKITALLDAVDN